MPESDDIISHLSSPKPNKVPSLPSDPFGPGKALTESPKCLENAGGGPTGPGAISSDNFQTFMGLPMAMPIRLSSNVSLGKPIANVSEIMLRKSRALKDNFLLCMYVCVTKEKSYRARLDNFFLHASSKKVSYALIWSPALRSGGWT